MSETNQTSIDLKVQSSGLPMRFYEKTFDNYKTTCQQQQQALKAVMSYAAETKTLAMGRSLIMSGSVGTGKTHLAAAIIRDVVTREPNISAVYCTVRGMIRDIRATWRGGDVSELEAINHFADADLLIIDEIGVQFGSPSESVLLFDVIDRRYGACLPTVLISNLSPAEMKEIMTERVVDRLREDSGMLVELHWGSKRGEKND